jgi:hypothetical protein
MGRLALELRGFKKSTRLSTLRLSPRPALELMLRWRLWTEGGEGGEGDEELLTI